VTNEPLSDKLGETAAFDGRETIGALAVCADAVATMAATKAKLPIIILPDEIELAPNPRLLRPGVKRGYRKRVPRLLVLAALPESGRTSAWRSEAPAVARHGR